MECRCSLAWANLALYNIDELVRQCNYNKAEGFSAGGSCTCSMFVQHLSGCCQGTGDAGHYLCECILRMPCKLPGQIFRRKSDEFSFDAI